MVSTVFLKRLRRRNPDAQITVLCASHLASLFETHPDVHSVLKLPYPNETVFSVGRFLKSGAYDAAYILPHSFRAALECALAQIPVRIGYRGDFRSLLLTQALPYNPRLLYAHRYLSLLGEERFQLDETAPYFPANQPSVLPALKKPVLGLAPVSIAPSRTWDPERFAQVANRFLDARGGTVVLFGSAGERDKIDKVKARIKGAVIDTVGGLTLPEVGWMMKECDLLLANDSGLMHVASAFKIPTVVLFGASDPSFALPPWGRFIPLQHKEIFCVPCLRNYCVRFGDDHNACLKAIQIGEVVSAVDQLFSRT